MSGRTRVIVGAAAALMVGAAALALLFRADTPSPEPMPTFADGLSIRANLSPRSYFFGDPMFAQVEVLVDRTVFDPGKIDVDTRFAPFTVVRTSRERRDFSDLTRLRYVYRLECLVIECVPESIERPIQFAPVVVMHDKTEIEELVWPGFPIVARVRETSISAVPGSDWRASPVLVAPTYRTNGVLLTVLIAAGGVALLGLAAVLTVAGSAGLTRRWRRLRLTPLERALAVLERANEAGIEADQRLALDRLADELRTRGAGDLSLAARRLAWAEDIPGVERTAPLSAGVRDLLHGRTNGRP